MTYRCPLGNLQPTPIDAERIKLDGWQSQGILVVQKDDKRLNFFQREIVKQIGKLFFGNIRG